MMEMIMESDEEMHSATAEYSHSTASLDEDDDDEPFDIQSAKQVGGDVWAFGYGLFGQLGRGAANTRPLTVPRPVPGLRNIVQVACGESFSFAVAADGTAFSFGCNRYGQLGVGDKLPRYEPTPVTYLSSAGVAVRAVACGTDHAALLSDYGELYTCGLGLYGRLGHGSNASCLYPEKLRYLTGHRVAAIGCGAWHTAVLTDMGLFTMGSNRYGATGHGRTTLQMTPKLVTGMQGKTIVGLACGKHHTLCLTDLDEVYGCGFGLHGQLGQGKKAAVINFALLPALSKLHTAALSAGSSHTLLLSTSSALRVTGYLSEDQLGLSDGGEEYFFVPQTVKTGKGEQVTAMSAGNFESAFVTRAGELYVFNSGSDRQPRSDPLAPVRLSAAGHTFFAVACGGAHTLAVTSPRPTSRK
eukprot:TRINITY_DN30824_c0_g1_i1.p1 TRINITY_DN30824_c0_g1~~TRINITY_DN30824_c0_g1_i1.p1  ORF type:complete len:413 (-),score=138.18 TRINITY_DN30824_c0_g1_i1:592-1830(-)